MRQCLFLDLKDDPALIAQYEAHHRAIWPEVERHLHAQGVTSLQIWRLGTRLCRVTETDDARFDAVRMARAQAADARIAGVGGLDVALPGTDAVHARRGASGWRGRRCFELARERRAG